VFGCAIYLLGMAKGNLYAFWLSAIALVWLILLAVFARLSALRLRFAIVSWQSRTLSARTKTEHQVSVSPAFTLPFFRLHYRIYGDFICGNSTSLFVSSESSAEPDGICHIPFYFPLCGTLRAQGRLSVRDLFGFVRVILQEMPQRDVVVKPPLFAVPEALRVDVTSSPEASRKQQTADEDKYYMREYVPGDRMKDINWKASFRVLELITRISPVSPEPSRLLRLELRPYSSQKENLLSLLHLNYVKSWMLSFLAAIQARHPEYRFHVRAGAYEQFVEDAQDLDVLNQALSTIHFQGEKQTGERVQDELFIFSTAFDAALPAYVASRSLAKTHLFRTVTTGEKKGLTVQFFQGHRGLALPRISRAGRIARSFIPRKIPAVPVRVNGFSVEEKLKMVPI